MLDLEFDLEAEPRHDPRSVAGQAGISSVAGSRILRLAARIAPFVRSAVESAGSLHPVNGPAFAEAIGGIAVRRAGQDVASVGWTGRR